MILSYGDFQKEIRKSREDAIEECAREVLKMLAVDEATKDILEAAVRHIRALKDKG